MIDSNPLSEQDLVSLKSSYISPQIAQEAGLVRVDSYEGSLIVGRSNSYGESFAGIVFPYYWPGEDRVREHRLRRDSPGLEMREDGTYKEVAKYLSPPGRSNMIYFVPETSAEDLQNFSLPVLLVEGEKKALALYRLMKENGRKFLILALPGVWNWRGKVGVTVDQYGRRQAVKGVIYDFDKINWQKRKVIILFDKNVKTNKSVSSARRELAAELRSRGSSVSFVEIPEQAVDQVNGIDDYLALYGPVETLKLFEIEIPALPKTAQTKTSSIVAQDLSIGFADRIAYDSESVTWRIYRENIWKSIPVEFVEKMIGDELTSIFSDGFSYEYLRSVMSFLKMHLAEENWTISKNLLPFTNGVLNLETNELQDHSSLNRFTWILPYEYNPQATCEKIDAWLEETTLYHNEVAELLKAYLRAILIGRVELQRFLELIGPGGTGKSTFIRLATALVGESNVFVTELKHLESNRFETSGIANKRLIIITDSERYGGNVTVLKALTGQDHIRNEQKFKAVGQGIVNQAMVVVAANELIQSSDYTSGLERRRLTIFLKNTVSAERQRNLIEFSAGIVYGEFAEDLSGLVNSLLQMSDNTMTELIKNTKVHVEAVREAAAEILAETNPLADWFGLRVEHDPEDQWDGKPARVKVGLAERNRELDKGEFKKNDEWLYPSYCEYCAGAGTRAVSLRRFGSLLEDLCLNQLKLENVWKERTRDGYHFFGIKLYSEQKLRELAGIQLTAW